MHEDAIDVKPSLRQAYPALDQFLAERSRSGLVFDFDGTLAPIVQNPAAARLSRRGRAALSVLAASFGAVAIVSGRGLEDLAGRVSVSGVWLAGSHGAVLWGPSGEVVSAGFDPASQSRLEAVATAIHSLPSGVRIEPKPGSVAFHYRGQEDNLALVDELTRRVGEAAAQAGFTAAPGRCLVELRLPGFDKGNAVNTVIDRTGIQSIVVAGDDWTDLDAFRGARNHPICSALAIAVRSAETPAPVLAEADVWAGGVPEIIRWLGHLERRVCEADQG